jgi:hypothetical protein
VEKISKRFFLWACIAVVSLLSAACGGGGSDSTAATTYGKARLINATGTAISLTSLNTSATSGTAATTQISSLAAAGTGDYITFETGTYTLTMAATDSSLVTATRNLTLAADTNYTVLAYKRKGAIQTFVFTDNQSTPTTGYATVRIANLSQDAGSLDMYLVTPGTTSLADLSPTFSAITYSTTTTEQSIAAGTYDIVFTANGSRTNIRLTLPSVNLASGAIITTALTGTTGGALVDGVLINQGSTVVFQPTANARVRVVGAFPPNGSTNSSIAATVGGTALKAVVSPSLGSYTLVSGGTSAYTVAVDGVNVASLPAATFAKGGDYTILAYGTSAAPLVSVLTDDNRIPDTGANIRLVNGAVQAAGIALIDNYVTVNDDAQFGSASAYATVAASSTSLLQITSPYAAFPGYSSSGVNIATGGVYSMFVLGTATTPIEVLSKDR